MVAKRYLEKSATKRDKSKPLNVLVAGFVQFGKTSNMMILSAILADRGFKYVCLPYLLFRFLSPFLAIIPIPSTNTRIYPSGETGGFVCKCWEITRAEFFWKVVPKGILTFYQIIILSGKTIVLRNQTAYRSHDAFAMPVTPQQKDDFYVSEKSIQRNK